nr:MAG TPA: hypothetical protein [Caudoviricetes sp.]
MTSDQSEPAQSLESRKPRMRRIGLIAKHN